MTKAFTDSARLKVDVMFHGIRYTEAMGRAATQAYPNFYPYRFESDEPNPTGQNKVAIPYLLKTGDGTLIRVQGNRKSHWAIEGDQGGGFRLVSDEPGDEGVPIDFEICPDWLSGKTGDAFPMAQTGVSLHGDMAVVNVAPGCEYFLTKHDGVSMRCTFCAYGAPDQRTAHLGQVAGRVAVPEQTLSRMQETLQLAIAEGKIRHIYLVGGSLQDAGQEGERFLDVARAVQAVNTDRIPVTLGSGALPDETLRQFFDEKLVENVCFNLEIWSEALFSQVCPGKNRFVGYDRWIESLERAVGLWGRGHVYTAMVAGIELEPEYGLSWEEAADLAIAGAEDLCARGIIPIYSLYWPVGQQHHPDYMHPLRNYFEKLNAACYEIRRQHDLQIWDGFMCHRCAYMQLECDIDRDPRHGNGNS